MKTDLHSHVLPGIDDGARNLKGSAAALKALSAQGVTHLALTPHYYPHQTELCDFLVRREQAYQSLRELPEANGFNFSLGAEVYFTDALFNHEELSPLCYKGTAFMLVELETQDRFSYAMERKLLRLTEDHSITPILAHIDRYPFLVGDPALLASLRSMGCLFQVNLQSFSPWLLRQRLYRLLCLGFVDFCGQDVHALPMPSKKRSVILAGIARKDREFVERCDRLAKERIFV